MIDHSAYELFCFKLKQSCFLQRAVINASTDTQTKVNREANEQLWVLKKIRLFLISHTVRNNGLLTKGAEKWDVCGFDWQSFPEGFKKPYELPENKICFAVN